MSKSYFQDIYVKCASRNIKIMDEKLSVRDCPSSWTLSECSSNARQEGKKIYVAHYEIHQVLSAFWYNMAYVQR